MNLSFLRQLFHLVSPDRRLLGTIIALIISGEAVAIALPLLVAWLLNNLAEGQVSSQQLVIFACCALSIQSHACLSRSMAGTT